MPEFKIRNRYNGTVVASGCAETFAAFIQENKHCLVQADLRGVDLNYLNLPLSDMFGVELVNANLCMANLSGSDLSMASLHGANLSSAILHRANLSGSCLTGANLSQADLRGASLSDAYLVKANLSGADLSRADLSGADLSGADLSLAELFQADLSGTILTGAIGLDIYKMTPLMMLLDQPGEIVAYKLINHRREGPFRGGVRYDIGKEISVDDADENPHHECAPGINVATLDWCLREWKPGFKILKVSFTAADIAAIPITTDGKFRVRRCRVVGEKDLAELGLRP